MSRVQSIERAFAVLGALADGPIGVTEVAERADLPKSTAARLLASLAHEGVVEQVPGDTRYRLGPRIGDAGGRPRPDPDARRRRPAVRSTELAAAAGEAAGLSRPRRRSASTTSTRSTRPNPVAVRDWTGLAHPAARGLVRAGPARLPAGRGRRALPRPAAGALHAERTVTDPARCASGCARSGATATPGSSRSSTRASRRWRPPSPTRTARSSPRSTSTGRRTGSRRPVARPRSAWPWRRPPAGSDARCVRRWADRSSGGRDRRRGRRPTRTCRRHRAS